MKHYLLIIFMMVVIVLGCSRDVVKTDEDMNKILYLVLRHSYEDGGFTVVSPKTRLSHYDFEDKKRIQQAKKYIREKLDIPGYNIDFLVDRLFTINMKQITLTLKSDSSKGYVIDYDGTYDKYFEKDGGGWEKWYKENPKAHGRTTVSIPVYDKKTGIVLVYKGTQTHWLAGSGWIIAYEYKDGKLKEIKRVMVWIS